ncbi:MAG: hypothetical protein OXC18_23360 [Desulfurellaceae bacterium]|nr:hypothetical protein [Desulfurellaceae bacterium]
MRAIVYPVGAEYTRKNLKKLDQSIRDTSTAIQQLYDLDEWDQASREKAKEIWLMLTQQRYSDVDHALHAWRLNAPHKMAFVQFLAYVKEQCLARVHWLRLFEQLTDRPLPEEEANHMLKYPVQPEPSPEIDQLLGLVEWIDSVTVNLVSEKGNVMVYFPEPKEKEDR